MKVRSRSLPPGWYPASKSGVSKQIEEFLAETGKPKEATAAAGVVPHAGWSFSGRIAIQVFRRISRSIRTLVVVGGHLPPSEGILSAFEGGYDTPLGIIEADLELLDYLKGKVRISEDRYPDNTVEVQLPFIKYLFPEVRSLALRAAPGTAAIRLGQALSEAQEALARPLAVVGSTDLTHYGLNYGFTPHGSGEDAVRWVKEINDRRLLEALLKLDLEAALELGVNENSACSVGGAVAAASFARSRGANHGELLQYMTSYDVYPHESFVGYAGIIFSGNGEPQKSSSA